MSAFVNNNFSTASLSTPLLWRYQMDLFPPIVDPDKQHPIFKMMLGDHYLPERNVLLEWSEGFHDRDGKFAYEFQSTFESSMWELYIFAFLKKLNSKVDFSYSAPDFVVSSPLELIIEATVALPAQGELGPVEHGEDFAPSDFALFNQQSTIRLLNSISSKIKKYRNSYSKDAHVADKPYVIAVASFDRPFSHYAVNRSILAALYGVYFDEENTIAMRSDSMIRYPVDSVVKNEKTNLPVGLFTTDEFSDVSAIIYSSLATWGKIRALADNPQAMTYYNTLHPSNDGLLPEVRFAHKSEYIEDLADGLHILHNPYAKSPLGIEALDHERVAQYVVDPSRGVDIIAPDDFLLLRQLRSAVPSSKDA
jgi:hypothetical protein